jgi:quercetin dioxygenase-like cupin family protein
MCARNLGFRQNRAKNWQNRESNAFADPATFSSGGRKHSQMANSIAVLALLLMPVTIGVGAAAKATHPEITITPATAQKVISGSPDRFTGSVRVQSLFDPGGPSPTSGGAVTFQPGAHSAWHTHPLGQILIVTHGVGWIQQWGGPVQVIRKGDVVWIPPGAKHWHGATPTTSMTHIAVQNTVNGVAVNWLEQVTAEQYQLKK